MTNMGKWLTLDTRRMDQQGWDPDGFIHVVPTRGMELHEMWISCPCDPVVMWSTRHETLIVSHPRRRHGREAAEFHP